MRRYGYPFRFDSSACASCKGNCCIGESGYIWINKKEQIFLAEHLQISMQNFFERYIDRFGGKDSLKEVKIGENNYACIFFDVENRKCSIYDFRPQQCRTFPFWPYYKQNPKMLAQECPGIHLDSEDS